MFALKYYADVLAFGVSLGIFVVFHVAGLCSIDCVIATHVAVFAGEPMGAALAEYYVTGDYVLFCVVLVCV